MTLPEIVLAILIVAFLAGVASFGIADMRGQSMCRARGYPQHDVTWNLTTYCVKRVNQTDSVVALNKLR